MLTPTKDDYWEQGFAIHHIRELFGPEAPAVLREVVRHSDRNYAFQDEFKEIGPSAIPTLIEMVRDESDPDGQYLAAECLGNCGPAAKSAVPALIEYAKGGKLEADKRWLVALSIGAIGPDARDAAPVLEQWVHDAQRNLDRIKAVEAETKPKLFESQIIGAEVELDYIVQALKRVRESQK
jgi:hypothetical protein